MRFEILIKICGCNEKQLTLILMRIRISIPCERGSKWIHCKIEIHDVSNTSKRLFSKFTCETIVKKKKQASISTGYKRNTQCANYGTVENSRKMRCQTFCFYTYSIQSKATKCIRQKYCLNRMWCGKLNLIRFYAINLRMRFECGEQHWKFVILLISNALWWITDSFGKKNWHTLIYMRSVLQTHS